MKKALIALGALALLGLVISPTAMAKPGGNGGPNCYDIYNEYTAGPVTVYQYSSCQYDAEYDSDWDPTDRLP